MKKIVIMMTVVVMLLCTAVFSGCENTNNTTGESAFVAKDMQYTYEIQINYGDGFKGAVDPVTDIFYISRWTSKSISYLPYYNENGIVMTLAALKNAGVTQITFADITDLNTQYVSLIYDVDTRVVYRHEWNGLRSMYFPYYAPNGLPYRYVNGELVEITDANTVTDATTVTE